MERIGGVGWGFLALILLMLAACGGGGGGDGGIEGTGLQRKLTGTAAVGKPLANTDVTVKDRHGRKKTAKTDANGRYELDVSDLDGPFLLKVDTDDKRELFAAAETDGTANIHPLSDVSCRNWFGARNRDVKSEFESNGEVTNAPRENELAAIRNALRALLHLAYAQFGINNPDSFDFDRTPFSADNSGFDALLDNLTITFVKNKITILLRDPITNLQAVIIIGFDLGDDLAAPDTTPPGTPSGLQAYAASQTGIVAVWNTPTDNVGIAGYNIYRDGAKIATSPYPVYSDTGLSTTTQYCYSVEAFDGAGNTSTKTDAVCATTLASADTTPPAFPQNLAAKEIGNTTLAVSWQPSPGDDILGYDVYRGPAGAVDTKIATTIANGYTDIELTPGTQYCYRVKAIDAAFNRSELSDESCATPPTASNTDTTPPTSSATPSGGQYAAAQNVELTCSDDTVDGCAAIYFTVDGSTPTTRSSIYAQPLVLSTNAIVRFFAVDKAGNAESTVHAETYTFSAIISVNVSGLTGTGLVLNNNGNALSIGTNGVSSFTTPVNVGSTYSVTVTTQPTNPAQVCNVTAGSGTVTSVNGPTISVACTTNSYTVSGMISGLIGSGLKLQLNGGNDQTIAANSTSFSFAVPLLSGSSYSVTVLTQPTNPAQTCVASSNSGTVNNGNVTTVSIDCPIPTFSVGGTVNGLNGSGLVLQNNGGNNLNITANGDFTFSSPIASGGSYNVTVLTQPSNPAQTCTIANATGSVTSAQITSIAVSCTNVAPATFKVGGTVSGLTGTVVLQNNGGDNLTVSANGGFTFGSPIEDGTGYNVTILTQPSGQTCSVTGASGTVSGSAVTSVSVNCVTNQGGSFTVGGNVAGLSGTVVLQNNGGDDLTVAANGGFAFATALANSAAYNVTVLTQPGGQTCNVTNGSGAVNNANVTGVVVNCVTNTNQSMNVTVVLNPDRVRPNTNILAHIYLTNTTGITANNVVLQATYPTSGAAAINQLYASDGGTCSGAICNPGDLITWNIGSLAAGDGVVVSIPITVLSSAAAGSTVTLPAEVLVDGVQVATDSKFVTVDTDNALSLALDDNQDTVVPGEQLVYTLTYGNRSTASVTGSTLTLPLPNGVTFVSASNGGVLSGNTVTWNLGTLLATQSGRQQVTVAVDGGLASGAILAVDSAQIAGTHPTTGAEVAQVRNATRVQMAPALGITLEMDPDPVRPGNTIDAKLTVTNRSGTTLLGTKLLARYPSDSRVAAINQAFVSDGGTCSNAVCNPSEFVTWNLGVLESGGAVTVTLPMPLNNANYAPAGSLVTLDASVVADGTPSSTISHTAAVDTDNALSLALDENKDTVKPGEQLVYTLTYGNRSTASVTTSTLSLPLPAGVTFVSATNGGTVKNNVVQWTLGTLQATQTGRQQVTVTVDNGLTDGTVLAVDAAQLSAYQATTGPELARAMSVARVLASPALGIEIEMVPDPVRPGYTINTKLTVTNRSGTTLLGAKLLARYPSDSRIAAINQAYLSGGGTCPNSVCNPSQFVTWNLGTLASGAMATVTLPLVVNNASYAPAGSLISLEASVVADGKPSSIISHTAAVDSDNALNLALDENKDTVAPGEPLVYTLTYGNRSTASVTSTTLSLPLPPGVTFDSATNGGTVVGNVVQWNLGTLQATQTGRQQVTVTVDNALADGTLLVVDAAQLAATQATTGPELARATNVTRVASAPDLGITLEMDPDPVRPGSTIIGKITVTNRSGSTLDGTTLQARYPSDSRVTAFNQSYLSAGGTCANSICNPSTFVTWNLGTMAAGAAVTVNLPMPVNNANYAPAGTLISLDASVVADGTLSSTITHTAAVDTDNALTLALDEDKDSVAPGEQLIYTMTYGNRSAANVTSSTLRLPLPAGVTFVSATNGGTLSGNEVVWSLSTLAPGQLGRQQATVNVNNGLANGMILTVDAAQLSGTHASTGPELARATNATRVITGNPIRVSVSLAPNPVANSTALTGTVTVTNLTTSDLTGVVLNVRWPGDGRVANINQSALSGGGTCPSSVCSSNAFATWILGTVTSGVPVTVTIPMTANVATYAPIGTVILLNADVTTDTGAQATASDTAAVGTGSF